MMRIYLNLEYQIIPAPGGLCQKWLNGQLIQPGATIKSAYHCIFRVAKTHKEYKKEYIELELERIQTQMTLKRMLRRARLISALRA